LPSVGKLFGCREEQTPRCQSHFIEHGRPCYKEIGDSKSSWPDQYEEATINACFFTKANKETTGQVVKLRFIHQLACSLCWNVMWSLVVQCVAYIYLLISVSKFHIELGSVCTDEDGLFELYIILEMRPKQYRLYYLFEFMTNFVSVNWRSRWACMCSNVSEWRGSPTWGSRNLELKVCELHHAIIGTCKNLSRKFPFCPKHSVFTFGLQVQETLNMVCLRRSFSITMSIALENKVYFDEC
jgi:hypothetical protein